MVGRGSSCAFSQNVRFGLFQWELNSGTSLAQARTVAGKVFTLGLFFTPWANRGLGIMLAMQMLLTSAPFMNTLFSTAPNRLRGGP